MKIFRQIQKQYMILGISSPQGSFEKYFSFSARVLLGFLLFGCIFASYSLYMFYEANGFMEYMVCISAISANVIIFVCFAAIVFRETTLFESIDNVERLIGARRKYPKSQRFFFKTCQQIEKLSEIIFLVIMKVALQCLILPKCIASFAVYFMTDSGRDSFELPLPMWFPLDSKDPIGYLASVLLQHIIYAYAYLIIASSLALGIGAYWIAVSTTKEIQRILQSINKKARANRNQPDELKVLFSEFVDAYGTIKQVLRNFSAIFQPIIMSLFTWSLLAISGALLSIQVQLMHHENISPVLLLIINGIFGLTTVLIACELGQRMNGAFEEVSITIEQFDWFLFPTKTQRMLPMIIGDAQQPVSFECFGSIKCSREVFESVIRGAFSYFMMLRQLSA